MSVMSSVTAVFSCLFPSSDGYSSGQERVREDRDEFWTILLPRWVRSRGGRGGRQRGGEEERE